MKTTKIALAALIASTIVGSTTSHAQGLGAIVGEALCGNCGAFEEADRIHGQIGRPLDGMAADAVDSELPGVGSAWQFNDQMNRGEIPFLPPPPVFR